MGDEEEKGNISERNEIVEDIMNNFEEIYDQMSNIIYNINDSRHGAAELNETEVIINDTEIVEDTSQTQKRPTRDNSGKGIARLEPTFTGKEYYSIKKNYNSL